MANFDFNLIEKSALVLDENQARKNLKKMAHKAAAQGIRFRPHFKTHQSAQVGDWFRVEDVESITVSSLSMALYFADHGWQDILVAFPVNLREMNTIKILAERVVLGLLVESPEVAAVLDSSLESPVDIWIKVDSGYHRTGIDSSNVEVIHTLAQSIRNSNNLKLRGLLTHAGQTYHAKSPDEIETMYAESCQTLVELNQELKKRSVVGLELSVGDTPGCWLSKDLGNVDEIRPGNFIFFDTMMMDFGVCTAEDIALAVACPIVALHPERGEVVIYGGAVHLSKDVIEKGNRRIYGYAAFPRKNGWDFHGRENYVKALSQEHGIVCLEAGAMASLKVGDLLYILPVHSCLAVGALGEYVSNQGARFSTMMTR